MYLNGDQILNFFYVFSLSFVSSLFLTVIRVGRGAADLLAVQRAHTRVTSRLGGMAVFLAVFIGTWFWFSNSQESSGYRLFILVSCPLLIAGLAEDLGYPIGVRARFLAAVFSGVLFVTVFGQWLPRLNIPFVDFAMTLPYFAIPFTVIACAGVTHAFNLTDGLNGLSALISICISIALMAICAKIGLWAHFQALGLLISAIAGFLFVNFPFGRLFLGDGGAYVIGHVLVWTAVSIVWNAKEVSAFSILLIFFWPIADTLLAIWRRRFLGIEITRPDRLHFHQFVMRGLEISILGRGYRAIANPLATVAIVPMACFPMFLGVVYYDSVNITILLSIFTFGAFLITYFAGISWLKSRKS